MRHKYWLLLQRFKIRVGAGRRSGLVKVKARSWRGSLTLISLFPCFLLQFSFSLLPLLLSSPHGSPLLFKLIIQLQVSLEMRGHKRWLHLKKKKHSSDYNHIIAVHIPSQTCHHLSQKVTNSRPTFNHSWTLNVPECTTAYTADKKKSKMEILFICAGNT